MKLLILITLSVLSVSSYAKPGANDFLEASRLWKDFRACQADVKDELKLINCTESFISKKITRYDKSKLTSMLIMGFTFSELKSCDGVKNLLPEMFSKEEKYFCMDVLGNTSKLKGFITVIIEKDQMRLSAIKYSEMPDYAEREKI